MKGNYTQPHMLVPGSVGEWASLRGNELGLYVRPVNGAVKVAGRFRSTPLDGATNGIFIEYGCTRIDVKNDSEHELLIAADPPIPLGADTLGQPFISVEGEPVASFTNFGFRDFIPVEGGEAYSLECSAEHLFFVHELGASAAEFRLTVLGLGPVGSRVLGAERLRR